MGNGGTVDIVLERDGTVIEDIPYLPRPEQVRAILGAVEGLRSVVAVGCRLFLVSNQAGIAHGHFTLSDLDTVDRTLDELLAAPGLAFTGRRYCPHGPAQGCRCRKPQTGMLLDLMGGPPLIPARPGTSEISCPTSTSASPQGVVPFSCGPGVAWRPRPTWTRHESVPPLLWTTWGARSRISCSGKG